MAKSRILRPKDIAERYNVCENTAIKYMRKMIHMENPLSVTEEALAQWERERTVGPQTTDEMAKARKKITRRATRTDPFDWHVPRTRPKAAGG